MASAGISTLGITFGYGVETTAGTKPTSFKHKLEGYFGYLWNGQVMD